MKYKTFLLWKNGKFQGRFGCWAMSYILNINPRDPELNDLDFSRADCGEDKYTWSRVRDPEHMFTHGEW